MNLKRISVSFFSLLLASQMTFSAQNVSFSANKVTLKSSLDVIIKPQQKNQTSGKKVKVRGVIKDETGEPIIGATVRIKGQSEGTVSDFDGNFTLDVTDANTLQISYIGYQTQEFAVGKQHHFSIVLEEDKTILNEVVVIGYGTRRKVILPAL